MISRRQFISLLGATACSAWLPGCAPKPQPVTIGLHVWPGYEPTPLARTMGWLDANLVKLVQTGSATDSLKLLAEGKVDGAGLTLDEVLRARENGIALSVLLVCDISAGADMFMTRPDIRTLSAIKGRKVGVEDGALGALMLYQVLQVAGLKHEDVQIVSLPVDHHAEAWKNGDIDAAVTYEPASARIMEMGGVRLFDSSETPDLILDVLAVRTSLLDAAHGEALRHLVSAHLRALSFINTNPGDAAYRMAARFNLPAEQVMPAFKGLVLPDLENNLRLLGTQSPSVMKSAQVIADAMLKAGILRKPARFDGLLQAEYLPREAP